MRIRFKRNCSASPKELFTVLAILSAIVGAVGVGFWMAGTPWVLVFSGVEILALTMAFLCYAQSTDDYEELSFTAEHLEVIHRIGGKTSVHRFQRAFVSFGFQAGWGSTLLIQQSGRVVHFGKLVPTQSRSALCKALQRRVREVGNLDWISELSKLGGRDITAIKTQ